MQIIKYKNILTSSFMFKFYLLQLFFHNAYALHHMEKRMSLETCLGRFDVHKNTIIRTGESQALGGSYIEGVALDTIEECQRLCCETENCDVYIFEAKMDGFCYLFDCGSPDNFHCKFTRHANYTSAVLTKPRQSAPTTIAPFASDVYVSEQEFELTKLKGKPQIHQVNQKDEKLADSLNNMATSKTQTTMSSVTALPQCGRFQFACHSGECIAIYNACDGIPQCTDGSDEGPECSGAPVKSNAPSKDVPLSESNVVPQTTESTVPKDFPKPVDNRNDSDDIIRQKVLAELHTQLDNPDLMMLTHSDVGAKIVCFNDTNSIKEILKSGPNKSNKLPVADIYIGPYVREDDDISTADMVFSPHLRKLVFESAQKDLERERAAMARRTTPKPTASQTVGVQKNKINVQRISPLTDRKIQVAGSIPKETVTVTDQPAANTDNNKQQVTEQPKKKSDKNKKQKPKVDELESDNKPTSPPNHAQIRALEEQHKAIHDNLGLEFHDHDGHAERPGGAMISLTLGFLVIAALAIVIGCRMRTVRRRIRRPGGKSFGQDSDFLVNGMYL